MIVRDMILLIIAAIVSKLAVRWGIGIIVLVVGLILLVLGRTGRAGRRATPLRLIGAVQTDSFPSTVPRSWA